jgi:hypothetical protein
MRFLGWDSNGEFRMTKDLGKDDVPPYAILSHPGETMTKRLLMKTCQEARKSLRPGIIRFGSVESKLPAMVSNIFG